MERFGPAVLPGQRGDRFEADTGTAPGRRFSPANCP
jgi:hypothetical protein